MTQFLQSLPGSLIGVLAFFSWIPFAWLAFKLIEWQREGAEKRVEEFEAEQERTPAWQKDSDYWTKVRR